LFVSETYFRTLKQIIEVLEDLLIMRKNYYKKKIISCLRLIYVQNFIGKNHKITG